MLTILHGDDTVKIHTHLTSLITSANERSVQVIRLDGKSITMGDLETAVGTDELFASEKLVIIDRLHSGPKSTAKDELIGWIAQQPLPDPSLERRGNSGTTSIVLVEDKLLTATQLKKFPSAKALAFKLPVLLFSFIEQIGVVPPAASIAMHQQVLQVSEAELVFAMLCRQVRTLLAFVADGVYEGPPFGRSKVQTQARKFTLEKLLAIHKELLDIDYRQKTSRNSLTLAQEVDVLLLSL